MRKFIGYNFELKSETGETRPEKDISTMASAFAKTVVRRGTADKYYESSAIFSKYLKPEQIDKV